MIHDDDAKEDMEEWIVRNRPFVSFPLRGGPGAEALSSSFTILLQNHLTI